MWKFTTYDRWKNGRTPSEDKYSHGLWPDELKIDNNYKQFKNLILRVFVRNTVNIITSRGRRGRDRMVVGFATTYAISAYHHQRCEFEPRSG